MKKLLILLALWFTTISANASLITIDIEDKAYGINDSLTANIYISELEDSLGIQALVSGFTFDFSFQESLLNFERVMFGSNIDVDPTLPSFRTDAYISGQPFTVAETSFAFFSDLDLAQSGLNRFLLASVDFTVLGNGLANFALNNANAFDNFALPHSVVDTRGASVQLGNQVSVPEPSSMAIFALAMMLLVSRKLRRS
ncbi:PEP-CTERM sorting domain-containing protein [Cognaticolwellia mytili]|uniref:PEP-CTERM sorting domain-containing protein n=1 Tax=Cognaticolwellia mytili TaxID=1888913 RepID=UPI000A170C75|nr:PEP-CTERM sorting domain-containing protein [Cognaticolwellia mytili]